MVKKLMSGTLAVTTFSWLLGASLFVPIASAQTNTDLQAQIQNLLSQIATLQAQLNGGSQAPAAFNFTRNLTVGSTGNDVQALQVFLNSHGVLVSGGTGAGSPGHETMYFGSLTKAALAQWQGANGVSPAVGYFGPLTRAKIASLGGVVITPPGNTPPPSGTTGVFISTDSPGAGTVVTNQSQADLAHFIFNGNYTVTNIVLKRIGVSADSSLSNVFLFDGPNRITDAASVSSGSLINFSNPNGLFTVNGTKTISVKSDLAANSGETLGVQLVSYTITGGSAQTVNLSGNLFSVASATLAGVALSATTTVSADPANDVVVWQGTAAISNRNVVFNRLALREIGSVNVTDVRNFRLYVDGTMVGSAVANADAYGYVTFSNLGANLITGSRTIKVLADVVGGSSRTLQMSLRGAYDMNVTDTQYNVNPAVTAIGGFPFGPALATITSGTMTVVKTTDSPSTAVTLNGSNVLLARYTFTAYGEPIKVQTLNVGVTGSNGADTTSTLRNGYVYVNGAQYGSTATINTAASGGTAYTTNFTVNPGSPATVEVYADVYNQAGGLAFASGQNLQITLKAGSSNATPQVSLSPINVPIGDTTGNVVSISSGAITLTKTTSYGNQTTVIPQTAYKLADFSITNGNVENVNVNTLTLTYTASGTFSNADLSSVYIVYGSSQTTPKASPGTSDSYNVSFPVAKNATVPIQVYGNILSGAITTGDAITANLAVTATTASGQTANVAATPGQKITGVSGGTFTAALDASSPVSQIVAASGSVTTLVAKIQPVNDSLNLTGATVTIVDPSSVTSFDLLYNGAAIRTGLPAATSTAVTGLSQNILANATGLLSVRLNLNGVGVGMGATGGAITTGFSAFTGTSGSAGGTASVTGAPVNGAATYVYKAIPVITKGTNGVATSLGAGTKTVADFTIAPSSGTIGWKQLVFTVTTSTASTTYASNGVGSTLFDVTASNYVPLDWATSTANGVFQLQTSQEQSLSASHEYQLNVVITTLAGFSTNNNMTFAIGRPTNSFLPSSQFTTFSTSTASFVWTDQSASAHGTSTADWASDFLVRNLPTNTWSLQN